MRVSRAMDSGISIRGCGGYNRGKAMKNFGEKVKAVLKEHGYTYKTRYYPGVYNRRDGLVIASFEKVIIYAGLVKHEICNDFDWDVEKRIMLKVLGKWRCQEQEGAKVNGVLQEMVAG